MPGSGKSYFGKKLAAHFAYPLIDLDNEIELKEGRTIAEVFAVEGEEYFRELEAEMLRKLTADHEQMILSTGGGTPCFYSGIDYMNAHGLTIFLKTPKEVLIERLSQKSHRPLIGGNAEQSVDALLDKRLKYYEQARISIDHRDPDLLVRHLQAL